MGYELGLIMTLLHKKRVPELLPKESNGSRDPKFLNSKSILDIY
jgi:hypothetical protein